MEYFVVFTLFLVSFASCSVIIPEELPSLLSVVYSNIPPIKKGTDSRIGFGFAFGNHADFQVMLELGPQTETMKLNGQPFPKSGNSNNKRQAPPPPPPPVKTNKNREKLLQTDAGKYLQNWAQKMKNPPKPNKKAKPEIFNLEESMVELVKNEKGEYEIHQPNPAIAQNTLDKLKRLYGEKKEEAKKMGQRSEEDVKKITEDLSNVDLE